MLPSLVALARGQHDVAALADRVEEGDVLARLGLLGELDVVDDLARARGVQAATTWAWQRARERPGLLEVVEGLVVDSDYEEALDRLGPAHVEACLERLALERGERAGLAGPEGDAERGERDRAQGEEATRCTECLGGGGHGFVLVAPARRADRGAPTVGLVVEAPRRRTLRRRRQQPSVELACPHTSLVGPECPPLDWTFVRLGQVMQLR